MAGWCKGSTLGSDPKDFGSIPDSATMRKGVQDMKKRLTSFLLVFALSFSLSLSVFAVDDMDYYSLPPVGGSEQSVAVDWPVNPADFSNADSRTLTRIYEIIQYLYLSPASWQSNSVIGFLEKIFVRLPSTLDTNFALQGSGRGMNTMLDEIAKWSMFSYNYLSSDNIAGNLGNIQRNTLASADRLLSLVNSVSGINGFATEVTASSIYSKLEECTRYAFNTLSSFNEVLYPVNSSSPDSSYGNRYDYYSADGSSVSYASFMFLLSRFANQFYSERDFEEGYPTVYKMIHRLQSTLASDDDVELAKNQKENREQVEQDFLNGKSGKTSLGKGDFSNASQVGGALNDTFNMGGTAKVSDFLSGFGSAGSESQSWFSQTTANNLNAVESGDGTQGVSTFSDDGEAMVDEDPDPYNMSSIFERYDWLQGVILDD